jgi:hypothetical protein
VLTLDSGDVILALQIEPELRAIPKIAAESHGCIGGARAATHSTFKMSVMRP